MPETLYLFSTPGETKPENDGEYIWKTILREGTFSFTPTNNGVKNQPFTVMAEGESDFKKGLISMSDIEDSFNDKAFEHVTIPLSHDDKELENTGFIDRLRRKVVDGITHLQGAMRFTEPEVKEKCERGSIANCSSGIFFNFTRKADGKQWRAALKHAALTNTPWITGLEPFGSIAASDDELSDDISVEGYQLEDGESTTPVVWQEEGSFNWVTQNLQSKLGELSDNARKLGSEAFYYVSDVHRDRALVREETTQSHWVVPYGITESGELDVADATRWIEAKNIMVAASDEEQPKKDKQSRPQLQMSDDSPKACLKRAQESRRLRLNNKQVRR